MLAAHPPGLRGKYNLVTATDIICRPDLLRQLVIRHEDDDGLSCIVLFLDNGI